jgi:hypothetical protein
MPVFLALLAALTSFDGPPPTDAYLESARQVPLEVGLLPEARALLQRSHVTAMEPRRGVPTILWAERVPGVRPPRAMGLGPAEAARQHLLRYAAVYRLHPEEIGRLAVTQMHDLGTDAVVVGFGRVVDGVPVLRDELDVVMTEGLELVALTGSLPVHTAPRSEFRLGVESALSTAARALTGELVKPERVTLPVPGWQRLDVPAPFVAPARARRVYFDDAEALVPAWQLEVVTARGAFAAVVAADDGRLLFLASLDDEVAHEYRAYAQPAAPFRPWDSPAGTVTMPLPGGSPTPYLPAHVAPALVSLDHAGLSTGDPWFATPAMELSGNNVHAYADLADPDGLPVDGGTGGDLRIAPSAPLRFDFTYDFDAEPDAAASQRAASATHAFFVTNWLHDVFYDFGFDEAARNGQRDNYGRGGLDGDPMLVEVHDPAIRNNANMRTLADGAPSRMQLFLFDVARPSTVTLSSAGLADGGFVAGGFPVVTASRAWDVVGDVVPVVEADGGLSGCGPWPPGLTGAVALVDRLGCSVRSRLDHALDAGAAAVLLAGVGCTTHVEPTMVGVCISEEAGLAVRDALDAGAAVQARLERPPPLVQRDVAFDTTVVAHEWGHFLTKRLVGDAIGLSSTAGRGLGEGWSDFLALWLTAEAQDVTVPDNDAWQGVFTVGGWVEAGFSFDGAPRASHYFGFRRYPYTTDRAKNPLTYRHVGTNVPLPPISQVPRAPGGGPDNAQVHNAGEVWASLLWEVQTRLFSRPGTTVDAARATMARYLVASLKATPVMPTFVEARDALLAVVFASSPTVDFPLVVQGFASRGLGLLAASADRRSSTNTPLAEDFTGAGGAYRLVSVTLDDDASCDDDGQLDSREQGSLVVRLQNIGTRRLTSSTLLAQVDSGPLVVLAGSLPVPPSEPFTIVEVEVPVRLGLVADAIFSTVNFTVLDALLATPGGRFTVEASLRLNRDVMDSSLEGFEVGAPGWDMGSVGSFPAEQAWYLRPWSPASRGFHAVGRNMDGAGESWLRSPPLAVGAGPLSFTFSHTYTFEHNPMTGVYFDGGRLEVSTDGETFEAIPASAISGGYPATLAAGTANPLAGQQAFSGVLTAAQVVTVSLGTQYANRTIWVRWRIGTDAAVGAAGWQVDDVEFTGLSVPPFKHLVTHRGQCRNRPPVITNTPSFAADERAEVTLVTGTVSDPDGDTLTTTWMQTSGPSVVLTGATFTAPEVTRDGALLGFRVVVDDGRGGTASDETTVRVRNVNRRPEVSVQAPQAVTSGDAVSLVATGTDEDGDVLRYSWQEEGSALVTLEGRDTATATFIAPEVEAATQLRFRVVVRDTDEASAPVFVAVVVAPRPATGCGCAALGPLGPGVALALVARRRRARA